MYACYWLISYVIICCICFDTVCVCGWVEAVLLCAEGQHTEVIPDKLKASEAYQSG